MCNDLGPVVPASPRLRTKNKPRGDLHLYFFPCLILGNFVHCLYIKEGKMKKLLVSTLILAAASNAFAKGIKFKVELPLDNFASGQGMTFFASDGEFCNKDPEEEGAFDFECDPDDWGLEFSPSTTLTPPDDGARFSGVYNKNPICLYFSDDECTPYMPGLIKIIDENGAFNYSVFERADGSYAWSDEPVELEVKWNYYFCEEFTKYLSCDNGYYIANGHDEYEFGGGNCVACPDGAYCPGGIDAPVYTVTININGLDMGSCDEMMGEECRPLEIYRSASAGTYCLNREKCTRDNKDPNDTLANGGYIEDSIGSWVPSDYRLFKSFGYFADSNSVSSPVLLADALSPEVYLEGMWDSISDQRVKPDWPDHMTIYAIATSM